MESKDDRPDTQTTPKGSEIPVPKRGDFFANLKKALRPVPATEPKKKS